MLILERLAEIERVSLLSGSHAENAAREMCVMEAVAWVAGEPWSDKPQCACPVIAAFMRSWNDSLPSDSDRERLLKPLIPVIVDTRATPDVEERRAFLAMDWLIRVFTPAWLDRVPALAGHATALRALEEIADTAGLVAAGERLNVVKTDAAAAWAAAWDAAGAAAGAAAWDAAGYAAGDAAWYAAGAAAWAAARDAAWPAARDAAWDALKPTTEWLQASAQDLVRRMAAVGAAQ